MTRLTIELDWSGLGDILFREAEDEPTEELATFDAGVRLSCGESGCMVCGELVPGVDLQGLSLAEREVAFARWPFGRR